MSARIRPAAARPLSSALIASLATTLLVVSTHADASKNSQRGVCVSLTQVAKRTPSQIDAMVAGFGVEAQLYPSAVCGAKQYRMVYKTVAPDGSITKASAGLIIPTGCDGPFPLVEYNHGTWTSAGQTLTDPSMFTAQEVTGQFGGQGYAVVMPDYLGYGANTLGYHPYLNAKSNADVTMDAVRATRNCLAGTNTLSSQLFLTGTSEGGYVTMATHRAMEALRTNEFAITASVSTSGPYALSDSTMEMLQNNDGVPAYAWMQLQGYQNSFGDVYAVSTDVFQEPYASQDGFQTLMPSKQSMTQLTKDGQLPPAIEGTPGLLTADFVQRYLNNPLEPARVHVEANDLRTFAPRAPLSVCYGSGDPQAMANAQAAVAYFKSRGVQVGSADIQAMPQYADFIAGMAGQNYHGNIEAPACTAWARQYAFDPLRAK